MVFDDSENRFSCNAYDNSLSFTARVKNWIKNAQRTLQSNEGGYGCASTWNESYDASTSQKFWIAKIGLTEIPEFPVVLIAVASAVVAITVVGLSVYFKKRKH